ncbi:hypothetical protein H0H87_002392, partial [Tephrocybe sp. NHM501043]
IDGVAVFKHGQATFEDRSPASKSISIISSDNLQNALDYAQYKVVDLYETRDNGKEMNKNMVPFYHELELRNHANSVWAWGHFDDGAMVDTMSTAMWERVGEHLAPIGAVMLATSKVQLAGAEAIATLEVFDSAGGWDLLFGKQLLKMFRVVHDYSNNTI